ncbi:nucleoside diphosphate kinase regulator [Sphingomonas turrisvirgatae]|uniref:Transcription elongation factor GreAB n=1 Tax=Sphingomonas turrisvirgatae TaxID=1888892 RepID=A0A1E3LZA1_9SPHN|nr:nucleoside diphosphate kinase regulator [Sphingomonas turrisvirgatae]ODP39064.1 transcription elongation factor GreAB [Sphingomonas turrisvirgatae]
MTTPSLPQLHIIDSEYDLIADLALRIDASQPELSSRLMTELERAQVHAAADIPAGVVTLNAQVDFIDEGSGARRSVQLVLPADADIESGKVSILTPVGAGLIGLSQGDSILWPDREGHPRTLRIVSVSPPAAACLA